MQIHCTPACHELGFCNIVESLNTVGLAQCSSLISETLQAHGISQALSKTNSYVFESWSN